jgi:uncharacterized membrane protein
VSLRAAIPIVAAATFLAGFGVAELTGVRAIGGLVLLAGGAWCARGALRIAGPAATVALVVIALALFVVSHPLGHAIGAWPAVTVSAALVAAAAVALVGRAGDGAGEDFRDRVRPQ